MGKKVKPVEAGDIVTFRLPVNTPEEVLNHLTKLKESKEFGKESSRAYVNAFLDELDDSPKVSLILPDTLPVDKKQWIENKESQRILGKWLYQLLTQNTVGPIDITGEEQQSSIEMPAPVQNLFDGIMAGMEDD
ncbi:hypothetical protein [Brevibacillus laterosporus]|uniref:hypothetical protein n=1 Tax=Brevibacillus TaxID=55080 RepID=UPI003D237584